VGDDLCAAATPRALARACARMPAAMASRVGLAIVGALVAIAACNRDPAPRIGSAGRGPLTLRRVET